MEKSILLNTFDIEEKRMQGNYDDFSNLDEHPNFEYLNALDDDKLKWNMVDIVKTEISEYCRFIDELLLRADAYEIFIVIHKLSTKFSILGMKNTYKFVKKIESDLKENMIQKNDHLYLKSLSEKLISTLEELQATG